MEPKLLEKLAEAVENTGHSVRRDESSLLIEPINVRVECELGERNQHQQGMVIAINIKATHEYLFPAGIRDSLAGVGIDEDEALSYGAAVWVDEVFSVIHELFVTPDKAGESVHRLDMVSKSQESGEEFAWKLYLGPIQATGFWRERITDERETFLVERLINEISSELYYKRMIWIKIFVSKLPDGSIHADCLLNNENWMEGLNAFTGLRKSGKTKMYLVLSSNLWLSCRASGVRSQMQTKSRKHCLNTNLLLMGMLLSSSPCRDVRFMGQCHQHWPMNHHSSVVTSPASSATGCAGAGGFRRSGTLPSTPMTTVLPGV